MKKISTKEYPYYKFTRKNIKKVNSLIAKVTFDNKTVSLNVVFTYIEAFKNIMIKLQKANFSFQKKFFELSKVRLKSH
ncbi:hypothetical protein BBF96_01535 [Anoxybacter fermentans]|uniref:Uncharacterized protein n=1 Tax=Anoxybacter fermentans TaxID=1323375 RepID=A0A3S9SV98_9FIRM|nr:hypothetical protein BBF96_01535 [Anoxybacter fermentans]